jgi:hypothetical protein
VEISKWRDNRCTSNNYFYPHSSAVRKPLDWESSSPILGEVRRGGCEAPLPNPNLLRWIWCSNGSICGVLIIIFVARFCHADDFKTDFESGSINDWKVFDEKDLGDLGPSSWNIAAGQIKGKALTQSSNIWGDKTDTVPIGTVIVYDKAEWTDFILDVDVLAADNDGMGVVWRFKDLARHYRFFTMIDGGNPPNGVRGPWRELEVRLGAGAGEKLPFYETLDIKKGESYQEGVLTHWKIEVKGDNFVVSIDGKKSLEANDKRYPDAGKIGFILYAQSGVFFDNLEITDIFPVEPKDRLTTTWGQLKHGRGN